MKPPVSYYGGKQRMLKHLTGMIPDHELYIEPFIGGGALFWSKDPSPAEVINDLDDDIVNFYKVLQNNFDELHELIHSTLHSRGLHSLASYVLKKSEDDKQERYSYFLGSDPNCSNTASINRAWAFWVQSNMSYSAKLFGGFAYCRSYKTSRTISNKRERFQETYKERLRNVCIECNDAVKVINSRDTVNTFHYCDPPYFNSDCGHYDGYTREDFEKLLQALSAIKGKFLLSSYPSDLLEEFRSQQGWKQKKFTKNLTAGKSNSGKKTEVLTWNY